MKKLNAKKGKDIKDYILNDYQFLEDYQVIDANKSNKQSFVAYIRNSDQKVRFIKRKYNQDQFNRFKALHKLYKNGIVLLDNLFILEECEELYYYVIEAQIDRNNPRFQTLQHYLYKNELSQEETKSILSKIKILIDCLHQEGQFYSGLDTRKIIIDQEKHLYLAPFDLQLQLKTDNFTRAYYPPQLLLKISTNQTQITEELMQKWDIWAFGCVSLQLMSYSSPIFMATSLPKQFKMIQNFYSKIEVNVIDPQIRNMIINSLCFDWKNRSISVKSIFQAAKSKQSLQNQQMLQQTLKSITDIKKDDISIKGTVLRELNLYSQEFQGGNCQLTINLFNLTNLVFEKELHITISLNRQYHFYLDYDQKQPKRYEINRKITLKGSFIKFTQILGKPIKIYLSEGQKQSKIEVCLQTLVIIQEGKRIWNQPMIGTYTTPSNSSFPRVRLKMSCCLASPQMDAIQKSKSEQEFYGTKACSQMIKHESITQKLNKKSEPIQQIQQIGRNVLTDIVNTIPTKNANSCESNKNKKIPSIAQISQQITRITQTFKKRIIKDEPTKQDDIQKHLSSLLQLH